MAARGRETVARRHVPVRRRHGGLHTGRLASLSDAWKASEAGTHAGRSTNTQATIMIGVTALALVAVVWRLNGYHTEPATPG